MDFRRLPPRWSSTGLSVEAVAIAEPDPHGEGPADARIRGDGAAGVSGTWDGPLDAAQISLFSGVLQARLVVGEAGAPAWEQRGMARGGSSGRLRQGWGVWWPPRPEWPGRRG